MVRLVHSVWTKPMVSDRWGISNQLTHNIWYFALSVVYAKKIGAKIVLHTDELGAAMYEFLPYDEVYLTLKDLDVNPRFWAAGKIFAQEAEQLGAIHLDGDVFLKSQKIIELLDLEGYDLIVQNKESDALNYSTNGIIKKSLKYVPFGFMQNTFAYNCGLVGFNDQALKNKYIDGYKYMLNALSNDVTLAAHFSNPQFSPDLTIEQVWLFNAAKVNAAKVNILLRGDVAKMAKNIGYTHVLGASKYSMLDIVKKRLKEIDLNIYKQVEKIASNG